MTYVSCACISSSDMRLNLPLASDSPTLAIRVSVLSRAVQERRFSIDIPQILNMSLSPIMRGSWSRFSRINCLANLRLLARAALKVWILFRGRWSFKKKSQGGMWDASACRATTALVGRENAALTSPWYALYSFKTNLDSTEHSWYYLPSQFMVLSFNGTKPHTKSRCLNVSFSTDKIQDSEFT